MSINEVSKCRPGLALWQDGDPWRDLTEDVDAAGAVTVVSQNGTARLVDTAERLQLRLALEGGHSMLGDAQWQPYRMLKLTPCGIVIHGDSYWARGTPLRLVLVGVLPRWMDSPHGRAAVEALIARRRPSSPNHPAKPCGAAYCEQG